MNEFIVDFMQFVLRQVMRFQAKDRDGWRGADAIYEDAYADRAVRNIRMGDYVDAANLCFLAAWAKARGKENKHGRI